MPVAIESILRRGVSRTVARNGLLLAGVWYVVSAVNALVGLGVARWVAQQGFLPPDVPVPPGAMREGFVAIPPAVGGLVSLLATLATVVLTIGALRTFTTDETERLRGEHFTRNLLWPGLNFIVGAVVFGIVVGIGFVLLVIPGLFLLVSLVFWSVYVAVEDENFVAALGDSWSLTSGHRLRLFLLGVAVVVVNIVVSAVFGLGGVLGGAIGLVIAQAGTALTSVFGLATLAAAYDDLVALRVVEGTAPSEDETPAPA